MGQPQSKGEKDIPEFKPDTEVIRIVDDPNYGRVKLVRETHSSHQMILKEFMYDTKQTFEEDMKFFKYRVSSDHPNIVQVIGYNTLHSQNLCSTVYKVNVYIEVLSKDLQTELMSRIRTNRYYEESDVLLLAENLTYALSTMQSKNTVHGDVRPLNIFVTGEGYKLTDPKLEVEKNTNALTKAIIHKSKTLLTSSLISKVPQGDYEFSEDKIKADVFSLGATLLGVATTTNPEDLYDYQAGEFFEVLLNERLALVKAKYSNYTYELIRDMLEFDESRRPDFLELYSRLQPYQDEINHRVDLPFYKTARSTQGEEIRVEKRVEVEKRAIISKPLQSTEMYHEEEEEEVFRRPQEQPKKAIQPQQPQYQQYQQPRSEQYVTSAPLSKNDLDDSDLERQFAAALARTQTTYSRVNAIDAMPKVIPIDAVQIRGGSFSSSTAPPVENTVKAVFDPSEYRIAPMVPEYKPPVEKKTEAEPEFRIASMYGYESTTRQPEEKVNKTVPVEENVPKETTNQFEFTRESFGNYLPGGSTTTQDYTATNNANTDAYGSYDTYKPSYTTDAYKTTTTTTTTYGVTGGWNTNNELKRSNVGGEQAVRSSAPVDIQQDKPKTTEDYLTKDVTRSTYEPTTYNYNTTSYATYQPSSYNFTYTTTTPGAADANSELKRSNVGGEQALRSSAAVDIDQYKPKTTEDYLTKDIKRSTYEPTTYNYTTTSYATYQPNSSNYTSTAVGGEQVVRSAAPADSEQYQPKTSEDYQNKDVTRATYEPTNTYKYSTTEYTTPYQPSSYNYTSTTTTTNYGLPAATTTTTDYLKKSIDIGKKSYDFPVYSTPVEQIKRSTAPTETPDYLASYTSKPDYAYTTYATGTTPESTTAGANTYGGYGDLKGYGVGSYEPGSYNSSYTYTSSYTTNKPLNVDLPKKDLGIVNEVSSALSKYTYTPVNFEGGKLDQSPLNF